MEDISTVNAGQAATVEPQTSTENTGASTTEQVNSAPAEQKPVQTKEENAAFAEMRRKSEKLQRDYDIARQYGHMGIYTEEDYSKALEAQEAQQKGVDPQFYQEFNSMKSKLDSMEREKTLIQQEHDLKNDPKIGSLFTQWEKEIKEYANKANCDLDVAFTIVSRNKLPDLIASQTQKGEQEALKKLNANASSTPGSFDSNNETVAPLTEEAIEKMSPAEMKKHWKEIKQFYNMK